MRDNITEQDRKLIDEWLKNNQVTKCEQGEYTDPDDMVYTWGNKKKKKSDAK